MNLGQVYTKDIVADFMASLFTLPNGSTVLDPCFGKGAFLKALMKDGRYSVEGVEIDAESYAFCVGKYPFSLLQGNFFDYSKKVDGIIMNPPYVRQEEINELSSLGISKRRLRENVTDGLDTKANLYMYFLVHGLNLLSDGGEMLVIFPNSWEKTKSGKSFKALMEQDCSIVKHIEVKGSPFYGDPIVEVEILKIKKQKGLPTTFKSITVGSDSIREENRNSASALKLDLTIPLSYIASVKRGKTTGYNRMFINPTIMDDSLLVDILSSPKDVYGFSTKGCRTDKYLYIRSKDSVSGEVKQYLDDCAQIIIRERKPKTLYDAIMSKPRWYDTSGASVGDILFPYIIRENIRFIKNEPRMLARDNFYTISSYSDKDLLMALLNNHFIWYQLEKCGKTYGNNVLKIQTYDVQELRIIKPESIENKDIEQLKNYGKELASKSSASTIDAITLLLEKYYGNNDIKTIYENVKAERFSK